MTSRGARGGAVSAAVALAVVLGGCGPTDDGSKSPAAAPAPAASSAAPPTPSPTPEPDRAAIRQVDFGTQTWVEVQRADKIALKKGKRTFKTVTWTTPKKWRTYADANDDGYLDALVGLQRVDGNGYEIGYYIWLWNPTAGQAQQVTDLVALTVRCGDEVTKTAAAKGGGFAVSEKIRLASDTTSCFDGGTLKTTRTVAVEDRWLVTTKPHRGYGGVCTESAYDGIIQPAAGKVTVRLAPYAQAPLAIASKKIELLLDNAPATNRRWPKEWVQVSYRPKGVGKDSGRLPCGFAKAATPVEERESE